MASAAGKWLFVQRHAMRTLYAQLHELGEEYWVWEAAPTRSALDLALVFKAARDQGCVRSVLNAVLEHTSHVLLAAYGLDATTLPRAQFGSFVRYARRADVPACQAVTVC
jgi:hypothetical protein